MRRTIVRALGLASALASFIVYMGWLGTADIAHRGFDIGLLLISAACLIWMSFLPARPVNKPG